MITTNMLTKKIMIVTGFALSLLNFRLDLIKAFLVEGCTVCVCAPFDEAVANALAALGVTFIAIPINRTGMNPWQDVKLLVTLIKNMRRLKPDVVFAYAHKPILYSMFAAKITRVPCNVGLVTGLGSVFTDHRVKSRLVARLLLLFYRMAFFCSHVMFFQNPDDQQFFKNKKLLQRTKAMVVNGSGVNRQHFCAKALPNPQLHFLMIARLLKSKGVAEYAAAAARLKARYPHVTCSLVGPYLQHPDAIDETDLAQWQSSDAIVYLGELADVRGAIDASSVYVLPSYREGTPRSVLEAMAMGRPIITTDVPGCRETVVPNVNGFLIPEKNVDALVEAMAYFVLHPEKIISMGEASQRIALEKYDVHAVNRVMLQAIHEFFM